MGKETGSFNPPVSVIIVNLNGKRFLLNNLTSVYGQTYKPVEVILVDNGSDDGSVSFVREKFPQTAIIENSENFGFAKANNQGIRVAGGKYIITLNNDTELDRFFIEELVKAAESSDLSTGMWAPKILSLEERSVIDSVGGLLIYPDGLARGRGRLETDRGQYDRAEEVFIPSACAALYSKSMLDEVGPFDEDFFAYCEDTDLGLRARIAGYRARSVPSAIVYHYYSGTSGRYTPLKAYLAERNHFWVAVKNFPLLNLALVPWYSLIRYKVQAFGVITGKGAGGRFVESFSKFKLLSILIKAYVHAIAGIPRMLAKRKEAQKMRKVAKSEIRSWFKRYGLGARELVLKD